MIELNNIKSEFKEIENIDLNTNHIFEIVKNITFIFKNIYNSRLINEKENVLLFGLDTLHYQMSLLEYEYNSLLNMYKFITNKVYSQYYKLLKMIVNYINNLNEFKDENKTYLSAINDKKKVYPVYKVLDLFKDYDFKVIKCLQSDVFDIINKLLVFINKKEDKLKYDEELSRNGINIDIFVNAIHFDVLIVKQNVDLYKKYLNIFNRYHKQYYSRLNIKLLILLGQINTDVKFQKLDKYNVADKMDISFNLFKYEMNILECIHLPDKFKGEFENIKMNINLDVSNENINNQLFVNDDTTNLYNTYIENDNEINLKDNNIENIDITYKFQENQERMNDNQIESHNNINIGDNIGELTSEELKNKWDNILKLNETIKSDSECNETNSINAMNNEITIDRHYSTIESVKDLIENMEDSIHCIENDRDEIDKWREIITNNEITQDEKKKLKAKLKKKKT
jgi:hypothetical protein